MSQHAFWVFSNCKGIGTRAEERRWSLDCRWDLQTHLRLHYSSDPLPSDFPKLVAEANRTTDIEDCPSENRTLTIVSDRVRAIIEEEAQGNYEFVPVEVRYRRKVLPVSYWVLHALHTIDCIDPVRSKASPSPPLMYYRYFIDESKVPDNVSVFFATHGMRELLIRDSLKRKLERAKVTGCWYYQP